MVPPLHITLKAGSAAPPAGVVATGTDTLLAVQPLAPVPVTVNVSETDGVNAIPFVNPLLQIYELAPVALRLTAAPAQTSCAGETFMAITGAGFTVMGTFKLVAEFVVEKGTDLTVNVVPSPSWPEVFVHRSSCRC